MYGASDLPPTLSLKLSLRRRPSRAAAGAALRQEEVEGGGDGGDLRAVADVGVRLRRVGVHLRGVSPTCTCRGRVARRVTGSASGRVGGSTPPSSSRTARRSPLRDAFRTGTSGVVGVSWACRGSVVCVSWARRVRVVGVSRTCRGREYGGRVAPAQRPRLRGEGMPITPSWSTGSPMIVPSGSAGAMCVTRLTCSRLEV